MFVPLAVSAWITPFPAGIPRSLLYHSYAFWIALTKNQLNHYFTYQLPHLFLDLDQRFPSQQASLAFWSKTSSASHPNPLNISNLPFLLFRLRTYHYLCYISLTLFYVSVTRMKLLEGKNFCFIPFILSLTSYRPSNISWMNEQPTKYCSGPEKIQSEKQKQSLFSVSFSILLFLHPPKLESPN